MKTATSGPQVRSNLLSISTLVMDVLHTLIQWKLTTTIIYSLEVEPKAKRWSTTTAGTMTALQVISHPCQQDSWPGTLETPLCGQSSITPTIIHKAKPFYLFPGLVFQEVPRSIRMKCTLTLLGSTWSTPRATGFSFWMQLQVCMSICRSWGLMEPLLIPFNMVVITALCYKILCMQEAQMWQTIVSSWAGKMIPQLLLRSLPWNRDLPRLCSRRLNLQVILSMELELSLSWQVPFTSLGPEIMEEDSHRW